MEDRTDVQHNHTVIINTEVVNKDEVERLEIKIDNLLREVEDLKQMVQVDNKISWWRRPIILTKVVLVSWILYLMTQVDGDPVKIGQLLELAKSLLTL